MQLQKMSLLLLFIACLLVPHAFSEDTVQWGYRYGNQSVVFEVPESAVPLLDESFRLNSIAKQFDANEDYENALACYNRALQLRLKAVGSEHPFTASIMGNIGRLYWEQEKYSQAEFFLQKAADIEIQHASPSSHDYKLIVNNLMDFYKQQGKTKEALALKKKAKR